MAEMVDKERESHSKETRAPELMIMISFVKEGEKKMRRVQGFQHSYLDGTSDWKMMVDLGNSLKFTIEIVTANQRPHMLLKSNTPKNFGLGELTVTSEERVEILGN